MTQHKSTWLDTLVVILVAPFLIFINVINYIHYKKQYHLRRKNERCYVCHKGYADWITDPTPNKYSSLGSLILRCKDHQDLTKYPPPQQTH
jgi:hypothetical protein